MSDELLMQLIGEVRETRAEVAAIKEDVAEIKEDSRETRKQTTRTNGRVTKLELWRHGLAMVADSRSTRRVWWLGVLAGSLIAGVGAATAAAFQAIT